MAKAPSNSRCTSGNAINGLKSHGVSSTMGFCVTASSTTYVATATIASLPLLISFSCMSLRAATSAPRSRRSGSKPKSPGIHPSPTSLRRRSDVGEGWMPGDFGFDPLRLLRGADVAARRDMQEKEINNGRLAMVAVATYVVEEAVTQKPIVELTPWLFKPLIAFPEVQRLFDGAFAISAFRPDL
mmetsp:Transcript_30004/g.74963  ORF Transcript_30004/g.74963 Transcript_30004/m.74963 type:complete len:185 (-) Transcript_30004:352-906(-)